MGLGFRVLLGGSWDLISKAIFDISTLIGVIVNSIISRVTSSITLVAKFRNTSSNKWGSARVLEPETIKLVTATLNPKP